MLVVWLLAWWWEDFPKVKINRNGFNGWGIALIVCLIIDILISGRYINSLLS